jgi:hypothetical protein
MSTFLMRFYKLVLTKSFSSPNKVLSLLDRMLSHTTHKHGLSGTYCFAFVEKILIHSSFDSHAYFAHFEH